MPKKDSRTSPPVARLAVRPAKPTVLPALRAKCMTRFAQNAESPHRFLSSPERIGPCTAASALPPAADNRIPHKEAPEVSSFRGFLYGRQRVLCWTKGTVLSVQHPKIVSLIQCALLDGKNRPLRPKKSAPSGFDGLQYLLYLRCFRRTGCRLRNRGRRPQTSAEWGRSACISGFRPSGRSPGK